MRITKKKLAVVAVAGMMLAGSQAMAQEMPTYSLEEIVIQADSVLQDNADTTVSVKTVSPGKASSIPELLRGSAGIDIQQRTGAGDNQDGTIKLRGFDARRYTVLLNGRQINAAGVMGGQYVDWTTIPLNTVEKIQIIKGGKSAAHGNTLGGVINIITREKGVNGGEINILSGSNGREDYLFNYGGSAGKLNFNIIANKTSSDAFLRNNDYDAKQYGLRLNYDITPDDNIAVGVNKTEAKRGFIVANTPGANFDPRFPVSDGEQLSPAVGAVTNSNPGAFWEKDNIYYDYAYKHKTDNGFWQIDYWKNDEKRREVNYNAAGQVAVDRTIVSDKSNNLGLSGQMKVEGHTIGYGGEYKQLRYGYGSFAVPAGVSDLYPSQKIDVWGAYIDDNWQLNNRWNAYFGLRYDHFSGRQDDERATLMRDYDEGALSPKLSLSFRNNDTTTTFMSVNRLWRSPSMAEYYWWGQNYNTAMASPAAGSNPGYNQQIKPEKGYSYEIGSQKKVSDKYNTKVTAYYQAINDYINFQHAFPFYCYNIDKVKVWGAEWENEYKLDDKNKIMLNYTNQHTSKVGATRPDAGMTGELDYRPMHKATLGYQYDAKPWQMRYSINFTGQQKALYNNAVNEIGSYTTHNLAVVRELDKTRAVSLYIDNIFDKQYVEQIGYPMPGRSYYVSLTKKI